MPAARLGKREVGGRCWEESINASTILGLALFKRARVSYAHRAITISNFKALSSS